MIIVEGLMLAMLFFASMALLSAILALGYPGLEPWVTFWRMLAWLAMFEMLAVWAAITAIKGIIKSVRLSAMGSGQDLPAADK